MDILLHGCCTRFSCTLMKWYSQLAVPPSIPFYLINELTNRLGLYQHPKLMTNFPLLIYHPRIFHIHLKRNRLVFPLTHSTIPLSSLRLFFSATPTLFSPHSGGARMVFYPINFSVSFSLAVEKRTLCR